MSEPRRPTIYGTVEVDVLGPGFTADAGEPVTGKPYLRLTFEDGLIVHLTAHLADMVGGAGRGALSRYEELRRGLPSQ